MQNAYNAHVAVEKATQDYENARPHAIALLPYLSPKDASNLRNAMVAIEHYLELARAATDFAQQVAAIEEARQSLTFVENTNDRNRTPRPGY
ncbi:hypothetical protein [Sphingomonas sp. PP-F2F-A104-K0414]|uniref:hypothetical protein n=1 Tax=Sphingomonas sp. PP-F2F-A104-K0414 TaxID=2135661 RepID=UPI00140486AF|nr:hypothetical protein [Sphingomonas sp. PP-F2F-A104-K0414]